MAGFEEAGLVAHIPGITYACFWGASHRSETGLTNRSYEYMKMYVQGVNCVAVGEIGLDYIWVRQN